MVGNGIDIDAIAAQDPPFAHVDQLFRDAGLDKICTKKVSFDDKSGKTYIPCTYPIGFLSPNGRDAASELS